jgi:SAM-dependent methyltransferase
VRSRAGSPPELNDPALVAREYSSLERFSLRRLDRSGWVRGSEPIPTLLAAIAEARPERVLDVGCGDGALAALLTTPKVVCVDQSAAAVDAARARGLDALQADVQALPFEDASFDVVMCNWVLYHVADLDRGLSELARVCRPGGRMVGAYNLPGHLEEVWAAIGARLPAETFNGETGLAPLARHFDRVERRDTEGEVLWENREALQSYLDAYSELLGALRAPDGPFPFRARRRNCVLVAVTGD